MGCHISKPNENANSTETKEDSGAVLLVPADTTRDVLSTGNDSEKTPLPYSPQATMEINPEDVVELEHAATKIQATFRGHVARKQAEKVKQEVVDLSEGMEKLASKVSGDEEIDVDLSDPDLNKAAVKIQASFRGHMARKEAEEAVIKPRAGNP